MEKLIEQYLKDETWYTGEFGQHFDVIGDVESKAVVKIYSCEHCPSPDIITITAMDLIVYLWEKVK